MELLKAATDWAKSEVFSSMFFILFGIFFLIAAIIFWQLGKTELAKAFIYPTMVAGVLLLIIGAGLVYSNKSRITSFPAAYESDASAFLQSEMERVKKTMAGFENNVFRVIPIIIVLAGLLILFIDKPLWRAIGMTTIAMMIIIMMVDTNSNARLKLYNNQLELMSEQEIKQ